MAFQGWGGLCCEPTRLATPSTACVGRLTPEHDLILSGNPNSATPTIQLLVYMILIVGTGHLPCCNNWARGTAVNMQGCAEKSADPQTDLLMYQTEGDYKPGPPLPHLDTRCRLLTLPAANKPAPAQHAALSCHALMSPSLDALLMGTVSSYIPSVWHWRARISTPLHPSDL